MSDHQSVEATRKAHSVSVGQVSTRSHSEGESEDHFEASSRVFSNPNQCHAVTYLFYRLNKTETVKLELIAIERRVIDPVAAMPVAANPLRAIGQIAAIPQEVPATAKERLTIEARGLQSEAQYAQGLAGRAGVVNRLALAPAAFGGVALEAAAELGLRQPLSQAIHAAALKEVDSQLVKEGLLDQVGGVASPQARERFGYQRKTSLPTAGVIVKGCLDTCNVCEIELQRKTQLEIERLDLQNQLLKRQIELLDQAQEYRCCPAPAVGGDSDG
jgi:hypothetical protein